MKAIYLFIIMLTAAGPIIEGQKASGMLIKKQATAVGIAPSEEKTRDEVIITHYTANFERQRSVLGDELRK
jgi:hypothetical protein